MIVLAKLDEVDELDELDELSARWLNKGSEHG
jgi:hypothetical protein